MWKYGGSAKDSGLDVMVGIWAGRWWVVQIECTDPVDGGVCGKEVSLLTASRMDSCL